MLRLLTLSVSVTLALASVAGAQERVPLSSLDLTLLRQGWGEAQIDKSIEGKPLRIAGRPASGVLRHRVVQRASLRVRRPGTVERP